jgi:antitoxin component of RelBE/YafQ-DinJ toxin-antitoxin module
MMGETKHAMRIRVSLAWRRWLERVANRLGMTSSEAIDEALRHTARTKWKEDLPPPRLEEPDR